MADAIDIEHPDRLYAEETMREVPESMSIQRITLSTLIAISTVTTSFAQYNRTSGAAVGGVAGAAIGAAIGENNDEPLAGALIGGALGLITGATVGQAKDNNIARQQAYAQQQQQQRMQGAVSTYDVAQMTRSGLGVQVVINHIQQNGVIKRPEVNDIIWMHQQGVPEPVISAMQNAPVGSPSMAPTTVVRTPAPVVVEEYHYVSPPPVVYRPRYYAPPRHHHHHHGHRGRPGYSFGISVGR